LATSGLEAAQACLVADDYDTFPQTVSAVQRALIDISTDLLFA